MIIWMLSIQENGRYIAVADESAWPQNVDPAAIHSHQQGTSIGISVLSDGCHSIPNNQRAENPVISSCVRGPIASYGSSENFVVL